MALLSRPRRPLALALLAMLIVPALAMPLRPFKAISPVENRLLAPEPTTPRNAADWLRLPRALDALVADHFAFRDAMIVAGRRLFGRAARADTLAPAVEGRHGRLFLTEGLLQSTGRERDEARDADYARFVCQAAAALKARGAQVIFALAPSPATLYPEDAPDWALPARSPTDHDLVLQAADACGVTGVDLRPALRAAKPTAQLYRTTDSHWTERGALIAFDALVEGAGHPEWRLDPANARWSPVTLTDGDLTRLAGLPPRPEPDLATPYVQPPPGATRRPLEGLAWREAPPFEAASGKPGSSLMIIGDSYTEHFFPGFFLNAGLARVAWVHEELCGFDWRAIDAVRPQYVLIMPVEREARCPAGRRPRGFPG